MAIYVKLIIKGTIEEKILELQEKKKIMSDNLIESDTNIESLSTLTETELKNLLSTSFIRQSHKNFT